YSYNEKPASTLAATALAPVASSSAAAAAPPSAGQPVVAVKVFVKTNGLYRVSAANLALAFGVTTNEIANTTSAVHNVGQSVSTARNGADIVFYGREYSSRYTDTNVYWIVPGTPDQA